MREASASFQHVKAWGCACLQGLFEESWGAHGVQRLAVEACWQRLPLVRQPALVAAAVCQPPAPGRFPV